MVAQLSVSSSSPTMNLPQSRSLSPHQDRRPARRGTSRYITSEYAIGQMTQMT